MNTTIKSAQCHALREHLKAFVDGELSLPRRLTARVHLSHCLLCQQEMREMKRIGREIRERESSTHDATALSPEFRARLLTHLNPLMPVSAVGASRPAPYWRQQPLVVFGSGAVAVAVCTVVVIPLLKETPGDWVATSAASPAVNNSVVPIKIIKSVPSPKLAPVASVEAAAAPARPSPVAVPVPPSLNQARNVAAARSLPHSFSSADSATEKDGPVSAAHAKSQALAYVAPLVPEADRKRDRTLNLYRFQKNETHVDVTVERLDAARQKVEELVTAGGGYIVTNSISDEKTRGKRAEVTVKVPGEQVDKFLTSFANLGEIAAKKTSDNSQKEEVAATPTNLSFADAAAGNQQKGRFSQKTLTQNSHNSGNLRSRNNGGVTRENELSVITLSLQENPNIETGKEREN